MTEASEPKRALVIGAHPDDIEFYMAGTLVLLRRARSGPDEVS